MFLNVYSIFDKKTASYSTPFFAQNHTEAQRTIYQTIYGDDGKTMLWNHASDFHLAYVGKFDGELGELVPEEREVVLEVGMLKESIRSEKRREEVQLELALKEGMEEHRRSKVEKDIQL